MVGTNCRERLFGQCGRSLRPWLGEPRRDWVTKTIANSFRVYSDWAQWHRVGSRELGGREDLLPGVDSRPLESGERIGVPAAVAVFHPHWPREWVERSTAASPALPRPAHGHPCGRARHRAGAYVAFDGYEPLLWLLVAASILAALSARAANARLEASGEIAQRNAAAAKSETERRRGVGGLRPSTGKLRRMYASERGTVNSLRP